MARRRRKKGFAASLTTLVIFGLAAFGGYTLYKQNEKEADNITKKMVKSTKSLVEAAADRAKSLADKIDVPMAVKEGVWTCWFRPDEETLKKCRSEESCSGSGVYSQHPEKHVAIELGATKCAKEFGACKLDYCERSR